MTKPKRRLPGDSHKVTRRIVGGSAFMVPVTGVREIVAYLVAFAADKTGLQIHSLTCLSTHYHQSDTDPEGRLGEYLAIFNGMMARVFNQRLGRTDCYFWDPKPPSVQTIVRPQDHIDEFLYVSANAVKHGLVPTAAEYPGFVITPDMIGQTLTIKRPDDGFFHRGTMPEEIDLHIYEPPGAEAVYGVGGFAREARRRVAERERAIQLDRGVAEIDVRVSGDERPRRAGSMRGFLGVAAVQATDPFKTFPAPKKKCYLREVICGSPEVLVHELALIGQFRIDYRKARKELLAGGNPVFPAGTYALRRWAGVKVAKPPPPLDFDEIEMLAA